MKKRNWIKKIPWFLAVLGICMPLIYQISEFHWIRNLRGYQAPPQDTAALSMPNLLDHSFQTYRESHLKYELRLKPFFIRLNNELKYQFYDKFSLPQITEGKDRWLYSPTSIDTYYGTETIDTAQIDVKIAKLRASIDSLNKRGTQFLFVIEPSKPGVYPEYLPDSDRPKDNILPSYRIWKEKLAQNQVPLMDAFSLFKEWKKDTDVHLFMKGGYHWSQYAVYRVWDTLYNRIGDMTDIQMRGYSYSDTLLTSKPNKIDSDLAEAANLYWSSLVNETYVYPQVQLGEDLNEKPKVLLVGDSFFWNMHIDDLPKKFFDHEFYFWYYYEQVYITGETHYAKMKEPLDLKDALEDTDIVIYMVFLNNLRYCCWDFVEDLNALLTSE